MAALALLCRMGNIRRVDVTIYAEQGGGNKKRHGAEAPVAFDRQTRTTEAEQAHSAKCFRGQRPMQLSFVRLLLQDDASLPRAAPGVKPPRRMSARHCFARVVG